MVKRLYTLRSNAYLCRTFFTIWERNRQSKHKNLCERKSHSGLFEAHFLKIAWEKDIAFSQQHHYKWNSSFVSKTRKISQTMFAFLLFHTKHTKTVFFEGGGLRRGHRKKIKSLLSQSLLVEKDVFLLGYRRNFKIFSNSLNFTKRTHKPDQPLLSLPSPSCFSFRSQD